MTGGPGYPQPPLYPDHCPDHQVAVPPKCGGCKKQKDANAARPSLSLVPANYCLVHAESFATVCRGCRADAIAEESA